MNAIFYKPLEKIVAERKKFIDNTNEEAKHNREKSASILNDRTEKLGSARQNAKKIISETSETSKKEKADLAQKAQSKAVSEINSAKDVLVQEKSSAQITLADNVVNLAQDISSKILGENVNIQDVDKDLINNIMREGD
jgi:F-type H+-transporting ATPase subunit b